MSDQPSSPQNPVLRALAAAFAQRLASGIIVLIAIILLSFLGLNMARGADLQSALGEAAGSTLTYGGRLLRGDLGESTAASINLLPVPVAQVVPDFLVKSLGLLAAAMLIAIPAGISLGLLAANRRGAGQSTGIMLASVIGISVPSFFAALLLQMLVIRITQLSGSPFLPVGGFGWDNHLVLPALVLAARPVAQIARVTSLTISEVLDQDYVRTARSKGLWPRTVLFRHVVRNAAIPILTTVGVSLRFALSSLPVVEFFFGWPGLGFNLLKAISQQDDDLTVILVLCLGALFIIVNLLLDLAYRLIDPRTRQAPAHIGQSLRGDFLRSLGTFLTDMVAAARRNPLRTWLENRRRPSTPSPFQATLAEKGPEPESLQLKRYRTRRWRSWVNALLGNLPLILGGLLVLGLLYVVVDGFRLAPHNPYNTQGLQIIDGEFIVPPFEPDPTHPWGTDVLGRDILSLVLIGAQQTLFLATLVVLARLAVGSLLGALAGWLKESWLDRLIVGTGETIAAFPSLLLAMIFILALGIREGLPPFVISLCLIGWSEIMQLVRSEVSSLRHRPFIEAAVATGLRVPRILSSHVLPNLFPTLTSIAALEMGAVLMLLGELGFIGIFIGGGAFAELDIGGAPYHYSDVPEWGALLSNVRPYARSYPWTALYPSLAFFIAILGFNLFGEGLRRVVARVGVGITRLFNRYTLLLGLITLVGIGWARGNTGPLPFYRTQASHFDGRQALAHVYALSDPALQGRALGTPGLGMAAGYIGQQFDTLGLQEAGEDLTYYQMRQRDYQILTSIPKLEIQDGGPAPVYHQDYVEYPDDYRNLGQVERPVRFVALGEIVVLGQFFQARIPALEDLDFSDEIVVVLSEREARLLRNVSRAGVMIVTDDPLVLDRPYTLSNQSPFFSLFGTNREVGQDTPMLWISAATAERLLNGSGMSLNDFQRRARSLAQDEIYQVATPTRVGLTIEGEFQEKELTTHVIGHLPGLSASEYGGLNNRLVVVMAQYDSPPVNPASNHYPAAVNNATGVAVMLEAVRAMQASDYQPARTFLFVAYSGEGFEGGEPVLPEISKFLQTRYGFSNAFEVEAVVELRGLGGGAGGRLQLGAGGSLRLANLFEQSARQMGVPVVRAGEQVDLSIVFEDRAQQDGGQEAPYVRLSWDGWQESASFSTDSPDQVSAEALEQAGRALSLGLMVLGREIQY